MLSAVLSSLTYQLSGLLTVARDPRLPCHRANSEDFSKFLDRCYEFEEIEQKRLLCLRFYGDMKP